MALSSLQVAAGAGIVSLLTLMAAWGRAEVAKTWSKTLVGDPYRHHALEVKAPPPPRVRFAVPVAWAVVVVSTLRALLLSLQILSLEVVRDRGTVICSEYPCEPPPMPTGPSFDSLSAGLLSVYLIVTGAAVGAFARWAWDVARDMNQVRSWAPLFTGGVLVVVALGLLPILELAAQEFARGHLVHHGGGGEFSQNMTLLHVAVVLLGMVSIAIARRSD